MDEIHEVAQKSSSVDRAEGLSSKQKRLKHRRRIEDVMEERQLKQFTDVYDYYFGGHD